MASTSAATSASIDARKEHKLSFAKIAAAGIKPPNVQQTPINNSNNLQSHDIPSPPRDGAAIVTPSNGHIQPSVPPTPKKIVQIASKESTQQSAPDIAGPEVRVQIVESVPQGAGQPAPEGRLMPSSDDIGTQVSSSSGSNKPPSLDGKSVASGTTFALDEKDSLRPDDSASVKAVEEDDMFSPPGSGLPGSRIGSDDGVRAFRDQLREISSMEPSRSRGPPVPQAYSGGAPKGVLYVPPQGPGIGPVPNATRSVPGTSPNADFPPDQKLLEALENPRDRVWVLKLEQDVIDFVKDPKESSLTLPNTHSFYRLLAHKMADYYMLGHLVEDSAAAVRLYKTPNCRIPAPLTGITAPSTAASTPPPSSTPAMKILRRGVDRAGPAIANGSNMPSKSGSENGESGEDDKKPKAPVTREEREARYEAARLRIMGSAKPTESPEAPKEKQDSRSSSTTGKKNKKKQRADSDDGFEARSAYSNYYTTTSFGSEGMQPTPYTMEYTDVNNSQYGGAYTQQSQGGAAAQMQGSNNTQWAQPQYQNVDPTQAWAQGQAGSYDLAGDFQRSMSFQHQIPLPGPNVNYGYGQQYYGQQQQQQAWPPQQQQQYPSQPQVSPSGYGFPQYGAGPQMQSEQPYQYGQLPSQAFPGRPSSKTEHPLPGSYKGKNFNPQSQSFVPGQSNSRPFTPQATPPTTSSNFGPGFVAPTQLQRQNSAQSASSGFGSPHHQNSPHGMHNRMQNQQPLTHPLPQPVFPRQPSPSLPLPPKPNPGPYRTVEQQQPPQQQMMAQPSMSMQQQPSMISKWSHPSLPAKPPPSAEPFDAGKLAQVQRQAPPFQSAAAVARQAGGATFATGITPAFGTMAQSGGGPGQIVNGSGAGLPKRP